MIILDRIYREPAALLALVTAVLAVLTGTDVLTQTGATIALGVVAAAVGALRYVVTPSAEVVVQRDSDGGAVAGAALKSVETGAPVAIGIVTTVPRSQTGEPSGVDGVGPAEPDLFD